MAKVIYENGVISTMFGLLKKDDTVKVIDRVWMTSQAKWKACGAMLGANPGCLFVGWFEDTVSQLKSILGDRAPVFLAPKMNPADGNGKLVILIEHYPLEQVEQNFFKRQQWKEIPVLSALDEPLFMRFGGKRTIEIIKKLGVGEDEILGHSMIRSAIKSAQRKLAGQVRAEQKASSQEKWFELNFRT